VLPHGQMEETCNTSNGAKQQTSLANLPGLGHSANVEERSAARPYEACRLDSIHKKAYLAFFRRRFIPRACASLYQSTYRLDWEMLVHKLPMFGCPPIFAMPTADIL
jgi:hypothetical protein